jgi:nitrite reductase/ring-hydroxylating ferredoxin subunit
VFDCSANINFTTVFKLKMKYSFYFFSLIIFTALFFLLARCKKNDTHSHPNIPNQSVNITIYPSDPQFATTIGVPGGWVYLTGGNKGIIVYRKSNTEFMAYERTCTYDPGSAYKLIVLSDNVTVMDSACSSKYLLLDGSVTQGPAASALKAYNCSYDGNSLYISN